MDRAKMKVLLIEDNPGDARLVETMLSEEFGDGYVLEHADRLSAGLKKLYDDGINLVLLDLTLPDSQELHTLNWVQIQGKGAPVIVLTGIDDEKLAMETVKAGAQDYLVKGQFSSKSLARSIHYSIERQRLTQELVKAQDALAQTRFLSEIGALAATVAHRLRTPLGAIRMAGFNISKKTSDRSLASHLSTIEKKVLESDKIINNLLYYASQLKEPHHKKMKINDIVKACIAEAKKQYAEQKVEIGFITEAPEDLLIEADEVLVREMFVNILDNAYDAIGDNAGRIDIVTALEKDGTVKISVKDSGEGVTKEDLERVFNPFFTTKVKGMGLGLPVCAQIARLHNGFITMDSEKGKGATVTVVLPVGA